MSTTIEGLVTGALLGNDFEEKSEETRSLLEIASESVNPSLVLAEGRGVESELADPEVVADPDRVRNIIARLGATYMSAGINRGIRNTSGQIDGPSLLLFALDYAEEPSSEKAEMVREKVFRNNNYMEANHLTRSTVTSLDYLGEIWDEKDLVERLSAYTDTKQPTVKRWVSGAGNPGGSNSSAIANLAKAIFELQAGCGMSVEEAREWWDAPNSELGGKSPHENALESSWGWSLSMEIRKAIGKAGGGIGFSDV